MWFYKGKIVKIQADKQIFIVALFYKIKSSPKTIIIAEYTENLLKPVPHTNLKIGEKFTKLFPIAIQHNLTLSHIFLLLSRVSHQHQGTK